MGRVEDAGGGRLRGCWQQFSASTSFPLATPDRSASGIGVPLGIAHGAGGRRSDRRVARGKLVLAENCCRQPEFKIVIETEDDVTPEVLEIEDGSKIIVSEGEAPEEELDSMAKQELREDAIFQRFKTKITREPGEILRHGRGSAPSGFLVKCPSRKGYSRFPCGAKRIFGCQVGPQLLRSVDWAPWPLLLRAADLALATQRNLSGGK
ncbi:hypothetical protein QTO34_010233, partial [Cnephaeus nilssonii]